MISISQLENALEAMAQLIKNKYLFYYCRTLNSVSQAMLRLKKV
jgi:hypothetical protein